MICSHNTTFKPINRSSALVIAGAWPQALMVALKLMVVAKRCSRSSCKSCKAPGGAPSGGAPSKVFGLRDFGTVVAVF